MGLRFKFNAILMITLILGLAASSAIFWKVAGNNAREQLHSQISVLRAQALAVRKYTSEEIKPLLADMSNLQFLPQTIPSFSAQTAFNNFREQFPDFSYKEATLNPTNLADKAVGWEQELVEQLRADPGLSEVPLIRSTLNGDQYTVAFPLKISSDDCLSCHSTPDKAPRSMVALYGDKNGFGWKKNEIVGAQIFSVPLSATQQQIRDNLVILVGSVGGIYLVLLVLLNLVLGRLVISPVTKMSEIAQAVSMGDTSRPEFTSESADEIGTLSRSFNRMRRSLDNALKMLEA
jgi:HAMP domain-containing protein